MIQYAPNPDLVSIYIHVPFCESKCRYCGFYSEPIDKHDPAAYVQAVIAELETYDLSPEQVQTLYIGGGTPTALPEELLLDLIEQTAGFFALEECTVEGNPSTVHTDMLRRLKEAGATRLSLGAQSFYHRELELLGRSHSADQIAMAVYQARQVGFNNINLDLIFAIPGSDVESFTHGLHCAIDLDVDHVSAYSLTHEKNTPLTRQIEEGTLTPISEDVDREMYYTAVDMLNKAGLRQYEISNFALRGRECQHNLTYWANRPWIGLGPAATSWYRGRRKTNMSDIREYIKRTGQGQDTAVEEHTPDAKEIACETAVLNLRRLRGIELTEYREQTGFDLMELFGRVVEENVGRNLLVQEENRLHLTREALVIADSVLADFAATGSE